ncbi:MAG: FAD-dependent oxidoreductase [Acidimicrobiia bacterium]
MPIPSAETDVVVLGSGAAGLTAALSAVTAGATVTVVEKAAELGGTTAVSGGMVWLPANPLAAAAGIEDSREKALAYLGSLSNGTMRPEMLEAFVDTVDELLDWLHSRTPLRFQLMARYPDYHPEHPGALPGGRSLEPSLRSSDPLGPWVDKLVGEPRRMLIQDIPSGGGTGVVAPDVLAQREAEHVEGLGRGIVAGLLHGLLDAGVEPHLETRATALVVEDGRVVGVRAVRAGDEVELRARRGVVIATGGFDYDEGLATAFLRGPIAHPPGVRSNTGDGLRLAQSVGASLGAMAHAWWVPVVAPPGQFEPDGTQSSLLLIRERTMPGTIMVNRHGVRFANEAANYNAFGAALHSFDIEGFRYANIPAYLVLDRRAVETFGCFGSPAGQEPPGWLTRADSIAELAGKLDVPAAALEATVARFNELVDGGRDLDFHRGNSLYDGWAGDQRFYGTPQATLGRIDEAPYYAATVHPSTLGTKGGPQTTIDGEVLHVDGHVIPGLYAAGNAMAAPTGIAYGGAGGTLGPAMVFAYRTGRALGRGT